MKRKGLAFCLALPYPSLGEWKITMNNVVANRIFSVACFAYAAFML